MKSGRRKPQVFRIFRVTAPTCSGELPMSSITRRVTVMTLANPVRDTSGWMDGQGTAGMALAR